MLMKWVKRIDLAEASCVPWITSPPPIPEDRPHRHARHGVGEGGVQPSTRLHRLGLGVRDCARLIFGVAFGGCSPLALGESAPPAGPRGSLAGSGSCAETVCRVQPKQHPGGARGSRSVATAMSGSARSRMPVMGGADGEHHHRGPRRTAPVRRSGLPMTAQEFVERLDIVGDAGHHPAHRHPVVERATGGVSRCRQRGLGAGRA